MGAASLIQMFHMTFFMQTDNIEGEDHEHSITSKINLVDLAGSERQSVAKTSGERLRVCTLVVIFK